MEEWHCGLARLALRRAGHAPLHARGRAVCDAVAQRGQRGGRGGEGEEFVDSGGVSHRLGAGRRVLRPAWRPVGPQPRVVPDDPHLRGVHGPVGVRADVVAVDDLPLPGCARHRRRMGHRLVVVVGDVAEALAAVDRRGAADRREHRHPRRVRGGLSDGGDQPSLRVSRRHPAGAADILDTAAGAGAGGMARREEARGTRRAERGGSVSRRGAADDAADDGGLRVLADGGRSCSGSRSICATCRNWRRGPRRRATSW